MEWVTPHIIRDAFNQAQFVLRANKRELKRIVLNYTTHLTRKQRARMNRDERTQIPFTSCTRSQMILFATWEGKALAIAHQYLRPDGQLAGSGMANPHAVFLNDRIIKLSRGP